MPRIAKITPDEPELVIHQVPADCDGVMIVNGEAQYIPRPPWYVRLWERIVPFRLWLWWQTRKIKMVEVPRDDIPDPPTDTRH